MAFASGVFSRIHNFVTDKANAINVTASRVDAELDGIATALSSAVLKDGTQTVTANIPLSGYKLTGVGDPTLAQDAATKNYVDTAATFENTDVRCATTANITIATALNNGDTLDGLTLADGESVLVKNQTAAEENGIYVVSASPARDTAFDTFDEHVGAILNVQEGTANAGLSFRNTNNTGGTLDTTGITFEAFGGAVSRASLGLATTDSPQFAGINVGHATDTTLTRVSAGVAAIEGVNIMMDSLLTTRGDTIYRNATVPARLAKGAAGDVLTMGADDPEWATPAAASAATQAQQETGTSTIVFVTPGRQHFHPGHPKCWAFATVAVGTPTLAASYNITSITDTATGRLTVTIATDFADANWACLSSIEANQTPNDPIFVCGNDAKLAGSVILESIDIDLGSSPTAAFGDPVAWNMAGFGDQA